MQTTRLPEDKCPICRHHFEAHTCVAEDGGPSPGDMSVCRECFAFLQYREDLTLEHYPDEFILELEDDVRIELVKIRNHFQHEYYRGAKM